MRCRLPCPCGTLSPREPGAQRPQFLRSPLAPWRQPLLKRPQPFWQLSRRKPLPRFGVQCSHPQLFGPFVRHVKILGHPTIARGRSQPGPIGRLIKWCPGTVGDRQSSRRSALGVGEPPAIIGQPVQTQPHGPGAQVGILRSVGQDHKPTILHHQRQPTAALLYIPANPLVTRSQMPGGGTPAQ